MSLEVVATEGFQDLQDHEKTALRYLQEHIAGPGYLIPSLIVAKLISNREIDAILVLSDGLILLELKHYRNRTIQIDSLSAKMRRYNDDGSVQEWDNPCRNLAYSAKVLSDLFKKAQVQATPIYGMLIFTHEQLDKLIVQGQVIQAIKRSVGKLHPQNPYEQREYSLLGGVAVCQLPAVPQALEALRREQSRSPVQLNLRECQRLKNVILGQMAPLPLEARLRIGSYIVEQELVTPEEDYRLKIGHQAVTDLPVWIKEYRRDILSLDPGADT
ncbi:MAG: NERD domain-containing protein [Anaerolineae bacterium]|nr:NERD domain-containing protein [Anaerolineae bacterium]